MATGDYCTTTEIKNRLWPSGSNPDVIDDVMLGSMITAVSRLIDRYTGRRFYTTTADETRYYTAQYSGILWPDDDIRSITTLYTDDDGDGTYEDTWTTGDYILCPENASLDSLPYTWIEVSDDGDYSFPVGIRKGVKIVGKFGYSAATSAQDTPAIVKEACLLQVERLFKRRDAPFGVISNPAGEMRVLNEIDADVKLLLSTVAKVF